jgi:hypothetical protein
VFARPCRITLVLTHACSRHLGLLLPRPSHSHARAKHASSTLRARSAQHLSTPPTSVRHRLHARATRSASLTFLPFQHRPRTAPAPTRLRATAASSCIASRAAHESVSHPYAASLLGTRASAPGSRPLPASALMLQSSASTSGPSLQRAAAALPTPSQTAASAHSPPRRPQPPARRRGCRAPALRLRQPLTLRRSGPCTRSLPQRRPVRFARLPFGPSRAAAVCCSPLLCAQSRPRLKLSLCQRAARALRVSALRQPPRCWPSTPAACSSRPPSARSGPCARLTLSARTASAWNRLLPRPDALLWRQRRSPWPATCLGRPPSEPAPPAWIQRRPPNVSPSLPLCRTSGGGEREGKTKG